MSVMKRAFWKTFWEDKKVIVAAIVAMLVFVLVVYGYFQFKRSWNYTIGYESRVQTTVCEMVKPEYLTTKGVSICD